MRSIYIAALMGAAAFTSASTGQWRNPLVNRQFPKYSQALLTTDFDGNGTTDIAYHVPFSSPGTRNVLCVARGPGHDPRIPLQIPVPKWVHQRGVIAIPGDYNADGFSDLAFHNPSASWASVPVVFGEAVGAAWRSTNAAAPSWANQPNVTALPGDYNGDGKTDIAFRRPGGAWNTIPILLARGDGTWTSVNRTVPAFAQESGSIAVQGDFNFDGRTDLAFYKPGGQWLSVPVLFATGNGSWHHVARVVRHRSREPFWANEPGVVAIPGDYNFDFKTDIAFHRPGSSWSTVPIAFSNGGGSWTVARSAAPSWANQPGVVAIPGDFNFDGASDLAFHRPGSSWKSVPVLLSLGSGSWASFNSSSPPWANESGAVAITGDFNNDGKSDIAFHRTRRDLLGNKANIQVLLSLGGTWRYFTRFTSSDAPAGVAVNPRVIAAPAPITAWAPPPPRAPTSLRASVSGTSVHLTWRDNSTSEFGYEIWRSTDGHRFNTRIGTVGSNTVSTRDRGVSLGKKYWYRVRALSYGAQPSGWSNVADVVTPPNCVAGVKLSFWWGSTTSGVLWGSDSRIDFQGTWIDGPCTTSGRTTFNEQEQLGRFSYPNIVRNNLWWWHRQVGLSGLRKGRWRIDMKLTTSGRIKFADSITVTLPAGGEVRLGPSPP